MNLLGPIKRSFLLGLHVCGQNWGVLQCGLVYRRAQADSDEVICKGRPVNKKARVSRDRVFYNVRRRLTVSGANVDIRKNGGSLR